MLHITLYCTQMKRLLIYQILSEFISFLDHLFIRSFHYCLQFSLFGKIAKVFGVIYLVILQVSNLVIFFWPS